MKVVLDVDVKDINKVNNVNIFFGENIFLLPVINLINTKDNSIKLQKT
jgi:hypothetical protein